MTEQNHNLIALLSDESFQRWLSGKASGEENKQWTEWLDAAPAHPALYAEALKLWKLGRFRPADLPDIEKEWQRLRPRLQLPAAKAASIRSLSSKRAFFPQDRNTRILWARFVAIAAAAVVVALLWRYLPFKIQSAKQEFQLAATGYGQRSRITLPDSTTIILNANSTLRYPAAWTATTPRQFELKGEAYFEVSSRPEGSQHDFAVHTADGAVQVVGTRFVVYERGQGTRVVVEEGGVEVAVADTISLSNIPVAQVQLRPGNMLQFRRGSRSLSPQLVNFGLHTTWWRDRLILEDTPFEQIIHRLEETYGIEVKVKDKLLLRRTLSGSIENRSLDVIVEALAKALRVPVHREGQAVIFGHAPEEGRNP
jgi:ferric-dicitrate binding protein FerR (iron transport regulator)